MNPKMTLHFRLATFNLRRELRLALLAAMETCWVFAVIVLLTALIERPQPLTPLPFFAAYWLALIVGRLLPESKLRWVILQAIAVTLAVVTLLAVARAELYPQIDWSDFVWLPRLFAGMLSFTNGIAVEHIVGLGVVYVFVRGLGFAQRPLSLWFIGFQFRIGIVVFFLFLLATGMAHSFDALRRNSYDPTVWIFVYFFVSLLAIALARMEEMENDVRYGPRWAITLLVAVALVLFIGFGVLQVFTLDTASTLLQLFSPLWVVMSGIIVLLAIPFGILAEWLVELLRPFFNNVSQLFSQLQQIFPQNQDVTKRIEESASMLTLLEPFLKILCVLVIVFAIGYWIARALNRRMTKIEDEQYAREAIDDKDDSEHARRATMAKRGAPRPRRRDLAAESIRRIYAALVARAADAGLPRRAAETPYEFLPRLQSQWRSETDDLNVITEAYVQVHYAEHAAAPEQVNGVRAAWQRVEKIVKRKS